MNDVALCANDVLRNDINYMLNTEGQVIVDYDAIGGDTVYSREYGKTATSRQILNDIRNYFNGARQSDLMRFHTEDSDVLYSEGDYSYEALTSKDDMTITTLHGIVPNTRVDLVAEAKKNAAKIGKTNPKDGSVSVYVKDIAADVLLGTDGLRHGLRRAKNLPNIANAIVMLNAGEILQHSIRINEMKPSQADATKSYVMIGTARHANGDLYIVRFVVNSFELASMDVLYAINAKKESATLNASRFKAKPLSVTDSTISIAQLLDYVNTYFPGILPKPVWEHYGYTQKPNGDLGDSVLYSEQDSDKLTNRVLLANALESVAQIKKLPCGSFLFLCCI